MREAEVCLFMSIVWLDAGGRDYLGTSYRKGQEPGETGIPDRFWGCPAKALPAEAKGNGYVIGVLIITHENTVVTRLGKELSVPLGSQGDARSYIDARFHD